MTPIPLAIRTRIIALYDRGRTTAAIADALGYCVAAVRRVRQHLGERETLVPATHRCGRRGRFTPEVRAELQRLRDARRDATLAELAASLAAGPLAVRVSPSTVDRWLGRHLGVTHEKRRPTPPSRPARTWPRPGPPGPRRWRTPAAGDVTRLVFLDESAATTAMDRRCARSPKGERALAAVPAGHWRVLTMIGAVALRGVVAAASVPAATDGDLFAGYVADVLGPALRPGDVAVMDNLSAHKRAVVGELVRAAGATVLYLPPYSPDLNPIELVRAKVTGLLRSAGARAVDGLGEAIAAAFGQVTLADLLGYFTHRGYAPATSKREML